MSLRLRVVEAGARARHVDWVDFDSLHPEDQDGARATASDVLDAMLDCLAENADRWPSETLTIHGLIFHLREDR